MKGENTERRDRSQEPLPRWFRTVRALYGLEQDDLARYIGRGRGAVGMYEQGRRRVPPDVIATIRSSFPLAPPPPQDGDVEIGFQALSEDRVATITYAGVVPCSSEWGDPLERQERRPIDVKFSGHNRFLCKVKGDSCYPALVPSDQTIWECDTDPPYGTIILAQRLTDGCCTVKELRYNEGLRRAILVPVNPAYDSPDDGDGWEAVARLVGVIRKSDGPEQTWYWPPGLKPSHLIK